jgi:hypothetical protein
MRVTAKVIHPITFTDGTFIKALPPHGAILFPSYTNPQGEMIVTEKKQPTNKQTPVHTIRVHDLISEIHSRQSLSGFRFYDFEVLRAFVTSTKRECRGTSFFSGNEHSLIQLVKQTCDWIRAKTEADAAADHPADSN